MMVRYKSIAALAVLTLCTACGQASPQLETLAAPTGEHSLAPRLTLTENGDVLLSWLDRTEQGHRFAMATFDGQRFSPAIEVARGDDFFANWADTPGVRVADDGRWLAHWLVRSGRGTYAYDIAMAWSDDRGSTWSEPFSPHDDGTLTEHGFVSTFPDPNSGEGIGAVWLDGRETQPAAEDRDHDHGHSHHHGAGAMTLRSAIIDDTGSIQNGELLDDRVCDCCPTGSAVTDEGAVVVYRNRSAEEIRDIYITRQTNEGWSEPRPVHQDGWAIDGCPVNGPDVIAQGQRVIVAWFTQAEATARVQVALSSDAGRTFSRPQVFDEGSALGRVALSWIADGFILSWLAQQDQHAIWRLARFDSAGAQIETADLTTVSESRISGIPRIQGDGHRVWASWTESHGDPARPRVRFGKVALQPLTP